MTWPMIYFKNGGGGGGGGGGIGNAVVSDYYQAQGLLDSVSFSPREAQALDDYTRGKENGTPIFDLINQELRNGDRKTHEQTINDLDRALQKLPKWQGVVERGMDISPGRIPALMSQMKTGNIVKLPSYTSTTLDPYHSLLDISNVRMNIRSKTGRALLKKSAFPDEREVLFKRNSSFRVTKYRKEWDGSQDIHIFDMTEV